jgi:hypothetical protein
MSHPGSTSRFALPLVAAAWLALCPVSILAAAPADESKVQSLDVFHNLLGDYRALYAGREPLCFTAIAPGDAGAFGVRFAFDSNLPGLQRIEWAEGDGEFRPLARGSVFVPFDEKSTSAQDRVFRVRPVFSPARAESVHTIRINWMTRAAFAQAGGHRKRDIVKIVSEPRLSYGTNKPENWKSFHPTSAERGFAQQQWGRLVEGAASDYEKAKILSRALMRELRGCGGMPSALIYDLPTFEKYESIRSGRTKFACAQFSEIFSKACNAFGVVNRWGFNHDNLQNDDVLIELGSSHLVTEIFDRELNQWVFIDGMMNTLGAYLGSVGPLTLHEFFLFINQPNRRPHLNVLYYDPETNAERTLPVDQCPKEFLSYRGWTKGFHTVYKD